MVHQRLYARCLLAEINLVSCHSQWIHNSHDKIQIERLAYLYFGADVNEEGGN